MAGPCGGGWGTEATHKGAKCRDRERCTGPGCRVRRPVRVDPVLVELEAAAKAAAVAKAEQVAEAL